MRSSAPSARLANDTKPSSAADMTERREAIQRYLDKPEQWAHKDFIRSNKAKCKELYLSCSNPRCVSKLGEELIGNSHMEKDFVVMVDKKLDMSHLQTLEAQKANSCTCSALYRLHLGCWQAFPQQGSWNEMIFKVPSNQSHSIWFYIHIWLIWQKMEPKSCSGQRSSWVHATVFPILIEEREWGVPGCPMPAGPGLPAGLALQVLSKKRNKNMHKWAFQANFLVLFWINSLRALMSAAVSQLLPVQVLCF